MAPVVSHMIQELHAPSNSSQVKLNEPAHQVYTYFMVHLLWLTLIEQQLHQLEILVLTPWFTAAAEVLVDYCTEYSWSRSHPSFDFLLLQSHYFGCLVAMMALLLLTSPNLSYRCLPCSGHTYLLLFVADPALTLNLLLTSTNQFLEQV